MRKLSITIQQMIFFKLGPSKMKRYKRVSIARFQWRLDHDKVDNVIPTEISKKKKPESLLLPHRLHEPCTPSISQLWKPHTGVMYMKWLCLCSLISHTWIAWHIKFSFIHYEKRIMLKKELFIFSLTVSLLKCQSFILTFAIRHHRNMKLLVLFHRVVVFT